MNMQKVGTFTQSKSRFKNEAPTGSNPMNTGLRAIHYANIRARQSGTVRGMVAHLTECRLIESPLLGRKELINSASGVTRSHSVSNWDCKTSLQHLAKPYGLTPPAVFTPEKILYRLWVNLFHLSETRAAVGFALDFCRNSKKYYSGFFGPLASLWKIPPCRWRGLRPPRGFSHRLSAGGCHE